MSDTMLAICRMAFNANLSPPQKPIMQYLQEIHILGEEDLLPNYIPPSILIQHYVSFRMALRRYRLCRCGWGMQWCSC